MMSIPSQPSLDGARRYTNEMLARVWANQSQKNGRGSHCLTYGQASMFFDGPTIYSYGTHFPMARIIQAPLARAGAVVLVNETTSSPTTSKHQHYVRRAIAQVYDASEVFRVDTSVLRDTCDGARNKAVYAYFTFRAVEWLKKSRTARSRKDEYLGECRTACANANRFAAVMGDAPRFPDNPDALELALALQPHQEAA